MNPRQIVLFALLAAACAAPDEPEVVDGQASVRAWVQESVELISEVQNLGERPIDIVAVHGDGVLQPTSTEPRVLGAGLTLHVPLVFTPTEAGPVEARVWLETDPPRQDPIFVHLSGEGIYYELTHQGTIDLGEVMVGCPGAFSVSLRTDADHPVQLLSLWIRDHAGERELPSNGPVVRAAGSTYQARLTYTPTRVGPIEAEVLAQHYSPDHDREAFARLVGVGMPEGECP